MAAAPRDCSKEHAPFERKSDNAGKHPRPRKGATAKKREREASRSRDRQAVEKTAPQKGDKKK